MAKNNIITRKMFLDWLDKYSSFVCHHTTTDGCVFLDIDGCDCGNVSKNGLSAYKNVTFNNPKSVDNWHTQNAQIGGYELPSVSFEDYCKLKNTK